MKILLKLSVFTMIISSCEKKYEFTLTSTEKIKLFQTIEFNLSEQNRYPIDSVIFKLDGEHIQSGTDLNAEIKSENLKLGKHTASALVFYQGKTKLLKSNLIITSDTKPKVYKYEIINTYPHDPEAFTQGIEYKDGFLYESTGKYGSSSLRKVELKTGKVLEKIDIPKDYFAEGITIMGDKIYQLTWHKRMGFIYNYSDFKKTGIFSYGHSKQGWGLTNDGEKMYKSDGTERIWILNKNTQREEGFIEVYTDKQSVKNLNELEYVDGMIYANVWQNNIILLINPKTGKVDGIADMNSMAKLVDQKDKQDDVLNGIAYDKENNRLFVTGKKWDKLFEIKLISKN